LKIATDNQLSISLIFLYSLITYAPFVCGNTVWLLPPYALVCDSVFKLSNKSCYQQLSAVTDLIVTCTCYMFNLRNARTRLLNKKSCWKW